MNFDHSEQQQMLRDALERFIREHYELRQRRQVLKTTNGFSLQHWSFFADMGLLALPFPEEDGGLGGTPADLMTAMEMIGRGLIVEPYFSSIILAGTLFGRIAGQERHRDQLKALMRGDHLIALAHAEPGGRFECGPVDTILTASGAQLSLKGSKRLVLHGNSANTLIVSARRLGDAAGEGTLVLCAVDSGSEGIAYRSYRTVDGLLACDIEFDDVAIGNDDVLVAGKRAHHELDYSVTNACAALCAEAYGCMQVLLDTTLEYVQTRRQFGRSIGSFQTLQHRLADCYTYCEQAKSMMLLANLTPRDDFPEWKRKVAAAKGMIAELAVKLGHEAIQMHGGMGTTDELAVGHYHKRLIMISKLFGGSAEQIDRFVEADPSYKVPA